jgi:hypothetical protein
MLDSDICNGEYNLASRDNAKLTIMPEDSTSRARQGEGERSFATVVGIASG